MDSRRFQRWRSSWYKLHYVNGIIWDSRKFYPSKLHTYINKFWKLQGTISVIQFLQNKFTLCFEKTEDLLRMLHNGPWLLNAGLIVLQEWQPFTALQSVSFQTVDLWLYVYGLPVDLYTLDMGRLFGNLFGVLLEFDRESPWNAYGLQLKARLLLSSKLKFHGVLTFASGACFDFFAQVERLDRICFHCLRIGHVERSCSEVLSNHYLELVCSWFIHGFSDFSIMVRYDWELNYYYQEDPLCKRFNFLCAQILFVLTFLHQMFQEAVSLAGELISVGTIFFENLSSMTDVHLHESFEVSSSNCTSCLE